MKQKEQQYFSDFEQDIKKQLDVYKITDIKNFPFKSLDDIKMAHNKKRNFNSH